jgi:hypothetical protein
MGPKLHDADHKLATLKILIFLECFLPQTLTCNNCSMSLAK